MLTILTKWDEIMPVLFASESVLRNHQGRLGYPDNSQYVMVESEAFQILEKCKYNFYSVCDFLGVPPRCWADQKVYLIKIDREKVSNLRMPSGSEAGVDANWIPGGMHKSGFSQAVIDAANIEDCMMMEVVWKS